MLFEHVYLSTCFSYDVKQTVGVRRLANPYCAHSCLLDNYWSSYKHLTCYGSGDFVAH